MEGKVFPDWIKQECSTADTNEELYSKFLKLELINKQSDEDADQVLCILKEISNEYTAANLQAQKIPEKFQVSLDTLPDSARKSVKCLCDHALYLQKYKNYVCVNTESERSEDLSKEKRLIQGEIDFLKTKTRDCKHEMNDLQRELEVTKKQIEEIDIETQDMGAIESEISSSKELLETLKAQLKEIGVTENIYPEVISENLRDVLNMKNDIDTQKQYLEIFDDLPPDVVQAKEALLNAKRKEEELSQKIASHVLN